MPIHPGLILHPLPLPIWYTSHSAQLLFYFAHKIIAKWRKSPTRANHLPVHLGHTSPVRKQLRHLHHPPKTPNESSPPGYCPHFNSCGNCSRTYQDTSNQAQALPHTTQIHLAHTSPVRKQLRRLPIHQQCQMIPHHQAIAPISILAEIA